VEFGPGWGNLTIDLAVMGHVVTAVEVEPQFCALIEQRCPPSGAVRTVCADMLDFEADEPFDAAVFFESFHHCADHRRMLERLHDIVRPDGVVVFGAEPVAEMAYPWGPRLDGLSLWSTRTYGWLELGFDPAYFRAALQRGGWEAERRLGPASTADVFLARAAR
jgi:SAM-dependent methyltransferase